MAWLLPSSKLQTAAALGMDSTSNRKLKVLFLLLLVSHVACDAQMASDWCRQDGRACSLYLYLLVCPSGGQAAAGGGLLVSDAAAGILTLSKRNKVDEDEDRLQSRLHQLLFGSRNQAAGLLTMGKRSGETAQRLLMPMSERAALAT